jgi:hypothetical protein
VHGACFVSNPLTVLGVRFFVAYVDDGPEISSEGKNDPNNRCRSQCRAKPTQISAKMIPKAGVA